MCKHVNAHGAYDCDVDWHDVNVILLISDYKWGGGHHKSLRKV